MAPPLPPPGAVIDKKYRVERVLGRGGMGAVLLVVHEHLGTRHALKLLAGDTWKDETFKKRFLREAQAAAALRSRHAAKVTDFGFEPSGAPYMVMEHLEGKDLRDLLDERGPLPPADVAHFLIQACDALAEAHASGIVHRDLKPSNLFLTRDEEDRPCIKVLDFGIAKVPPSSNDEHPLSTAGFFGTYPYVSPEQIRSTKDVDARADVWSLGVTAYELLTGALPFEGETHLQTSAKILEEEPLLPSRRRPGLPVALDGVVMACLAKRREERTPDTAALARALSPFAPKELDALVARIAQRLGAGEGAQGNDPPDEAPSSEKVELGSQTHVSWADATVPVPGGSRQVWPWLVAGAAALGLGALWVGLRAPEAPAEAPPAEAPPVAAVASAPPPPLPESPASRGAPPAARSLPDPTAPATAALAAAPAPGAPPTSTAAVISTPAALSAGAARPTAAASPRPTATQRVRFEPPPKPKPLPNLPSD